MHKGRLEAFSDGVLAIIITIMVLEIKVPHGDQWADLLPLYPIFLSYVLSFIYVGIYWNNHHHMLQAVKSINGPVLWANTHLLFWLSLIPFVTAWSGENHFAAVPGAAYGFVLFMSSIAYMILIRALVAVPGGNAALATAIGSDAKGILSSVLYVVGILFTFWIPTLAYVSYVIVALIWLIPDRRVERTLKESS